MIFAKYQDESRTLFLSLNLLELNIYLISLFMYSYLRNDLPEFLYIYNTRSISHIFIDYRRALNVEVPFFVKKVEGFRTKLPVTYKENSFPNVNFKLDKASLSANRKDFHRRRD